MTLKKNVFASDEMLDNKEATRQRQIEKMLELDKEKEQLLSTIEASKKNFRLQRADNASKRRLKSEILVPLIAEAAKITGIGRACKAVGMKISTYYRYLKPKPPSAKRVYASSPVAEILKQEVLALLEQERFSGCSPYKIFATLKEEGKFVCSVTTIYRIRRVLESSLQTPTETLDEIMSD